MSEVASTTALPVRKPMTWRMTLILTAAGFGPGALLYWIEGGLAVPPLLAGITLGLAGTMIGSATRAALGGGLVLGLLALHTLWPGLDPRIAALGFVGLAGWETARTGGRAMPLALICGVLIWSAPHLGLSSGHIGGLFSLGLIGGLALARYLALGHVPKLPPEGDRAGWRQAIFLAIGLLLSITLVRTLPTAHGVWIVQMFIMRAMAPTHLTVHQALRYLLGVLAGVLLALGLELSGLLTPHIAHLLSAATVVLGLRLLPLGPPWPVVPITLAVLLSLAPSPSEALFRSEAALIAASLAILLSVILDRLFRHTETAPGTIDRPSSFR